MTSIYILIILSAFLFFQGFFPVNRPNADINNEPPNKIQGIHLNTNELYSTNVTKTVFIVIDALRLDFADPKYMPLITELVNKNGCYNKIKVEIPTVTLPRIKALTVGNVPQFIDLVLNLASTEIISDSIIHSAVKDGRKVVFYGDDTWVKLFPNKFLRFEGTSSFFVRDFEVDKNVTRNVVVEINNTDWDLMILHYLDLDHIGHIHGPFSSLIPEKLKELDQNIYKYYTHLSAKYEDVLFIITGDHGMRDSGGHGGSTYAETNVPLLIIGSKCENNSFHQIDIPVNIAAILGLKIPSASIGRIHRSMTQFSTERYLYALYYNTFLLQQKSSCDDVFEEANKYYINFLKDSSQSNAYKATELYEKCLFIISNTLTQSSVKQNINYMLTASLILLNCLIIIIHTIISNKSYNSLNTYTMMCIIFTQYFINEFIIFCITIFIVSIFLLNNLYKLISSLKFIQKSNTVIAFILCCFIHPLTFFSSSYVEEEHQFWYFFNIMILICHIISLSKSKSYVYISFNVALLSFFRFLRTINSTGDKWANYPDLSDWFLEQNNVWYPIIFIIGLILVFLIEYYLTENYKLYQNVLNFITLTLIFIFKQNEGNIILGKIIWLLILLNFLLNFRNIKISSWILVITLLLKPYNIILIPYCIFSSYLFCRFYKSTELIVLYHIFLSNTLFFAQGHSNSLASVDISVGYIGLSSYQPFIVIGLVLCHTHAFSVLSHLLIFNQKNVIPLKIWQILFCNRLYILLITSAVTFIHRHHLFIWSVFAPKLFIEFSHILFLFCEYMLYKIYNYIFST